HSARTDVVDAQEGSEERDDQADTDAQLESPELSESNAEAHADKSTPPEPLDFRCSEMDRDRVFSRGPNRSVRTCRVQRRDLAALPASISEEFVVRPHRSHGQTDYIHKDVRPMR